ncbi:MAG: hypothetical protein DRP12_02580 [Candidatus Aenigmatarchaeota archaeon]|nr:MAG: hypothetical protein DRP12_02580 [Candidatus Aenigmarchaeota archaeon]
MKSGLGRNADKIVILLALTAIIVSQVLLVLNKHSDIKERFEKEIRISSPFELVWGLNRQADKPLILKEGKPVLEYSGSYSTLNGKPLWMHVFNVKAEGDRIFASFLEAGSYMVEQEVEVKEKEVIVRFYITPLHPLDSVELKLEHYKWFWKSVEQVGNKIVAEAEDGITELLLDIPPSGFRKNCNEEGCNFFDTIYTAENVTLRTLIAQEHVSFYPS